MARKRKSPEIEIFDSKKHEDTVDLGVWNVPSRWEDVTLQMLTDYLTEASDKEKMYQDDLNKSKAEMQKGKSAMEKLEKIDDKETGIDPQDPKYSMTDRDLLRIFAGKTEEEVQLLPVEAYDALMAKLSFLLEKRPEEKPASHIHYKNIHLCINDMEGLRFGEFNDAEKVLKANPYDYPSLLAILCREVTGVKTDHVTGFTYFVNEPYTHEFANKIFDKRREMFAKMPISDAMPLINFFFLRALTSTGVLRGSLTELETQVQDAARSIKDLAGSGVFKKSFMKRLITKLRGSLKSSRST